MAQGKQAKVLSNAQVQAMLRHLEAGRNADRNKVIFLLTVKAGLRAKEVAGLRWSSVLNSSGQIGDHIELIVCLPARSYREGTGLLPVVSRLVRESMSVIVE